MYIFVLLLLWVEFFGRTFQESSSSALCAQGEQEKSVHLFISLNFSALLRLHFGILHSHFTLFPTKPKSQAMTVWFAKTLSVYGAAL